MAYLYLAISAILAVVLLVRTITQLAQKKGRAARMTVIFGLAWVFIYTALLLGFGLTSKPRQLPLGEAKCFDEWCASLVKIQPVVGGFELTLEASNRGRRPQRPDTPRLFLVLDGKSQELASDDIKGRVPGGESARHEIHVQVPTNVVDAKFVVTEGGSPSILVVDDENSPFHAKSYWQLKP